MCVHKCGEGSTRCKSEWSSVCTSMEEASSVRVSESMCVYTYGGRTQYENEERVRGRYCTPCERGIQ